MAQNIILSYSSSLSKLKRSLSIIGKRSRDDEGKVLFEDITVGTNEEPIICDFFDAAMSQMVSAIRKFISYYNSTGTGTGKVITVGLDVPTNWNTNLVRPIGDAFDSYLIAYALFSWFTVTAPGIADKYLKESNSILSAITSMVFEKVEPSNPGSGYADVTGEIIETE